MAAERFTLRAAVYAMFIKEGKILLLRRFNTGWQDGKYSFPAGHLEAGEKVTDAVIREVLEEVGVELQPERLRFAHAMLRRSSDKEYLDFFFAVENWNGEPKNAEPDKCDDLSWFPLEELPPNLLGSVRSAIQSYRSGTLFSEFGWKKEEHE